MIEEKEDILDEISIFCSDLKQALREAMDADLFDRDADHWANPEPIMLGIIDQQRRKFIESFLLRHTSKVRC